MSLNQQYGNYVLQSQLGKGGMGVVYLAKDIHLNRDVVIKVMHRHLANQSNFKNRFIQEAQAAARLNHPSIVSVYSFSQDPLYIVMEYVPGSTLRHFISELSQKSATGDLLVTLPLLMQVANALHYAHQRGVVHRDIKPDNILIRGTADDKSDGSAVRAVVTDFGLAKLRGGIQTKQLSMMGTLAYMSPEQCKGKRDIDGRSDLYSLGIILYQLVTNRLPFDISTPQDAFTKHVSEVPIPVDAIDKTVPRSIVQIIDKALAKNPNDRQQSGQQLASELSKALSGLTTRERSRFTQHKRIYDVQQTQLFAESLLSSPPNLQPEPTHSQHLVRFVVGCPNASPTTYSFDKRRISIGRLPENDIVLDHHKVSRRHAAVELSDDGWHIIDLGSANGSHLEQQKLLPNNAQFWAAETLLRIGDCWIRREEQANVQRDPSLVAPSVQAQQQENSVPLAIQLSQTTFQLERGKTTTISVRCFNGSNMVRHIRFTQTGLPPEWMEGMDATARLMPNSHVEQELKVTLPLTTHQKAGEYPFQVIVHDVSDDKIGMGQAVATIPALYGYRLSWQAVQQTQHGCGKFRLNIENEGNADLTIQLTGEDDLGACDYHFRSLHVAVPATESKTVDVTVTPRQRLSAADYSGTQQFKLTTEARESPDLTQTIEGVWEKQQPSMELRLSAPTALDTYRGVCDAWVKNSSLEAMRVDLAVSNTGGTGEIVLADTSLSIKPGETKQTKIWLTPASRDRVTTLKFEVRAESDAFSFLTRTAQADWHYVPPQISIAKRDPAPRQKDILTRKSGAPPLKISPDNRRGNVRRLDSRPKYDVQPKPKRKSSWLRVIMWLLLIGGLLSLGFVWLANAGVF